MTDQLLDLQLRELFGTLPEVAPVAMVDRALGEASEISQRRPRFARFDPRAWPPQPRSVADPGVQRSVRIALVLALVAVLAAAVVGVGARLLTDRPAVHALLTPAGVLRTVVLAPTLTALADGRLLVVGQGGGGAPYVLLFDPTTGRSSGGGSVSLPYTGARALPDGRVLLFGSLPDVSDEPGPSVLGWFDVPTGRVTEAAELHAQHFAPGNAILPDGRVLIAGGLELATASTRSPDYLSSVEVFDPRTGVVADLPPLREGRMNFSMLALDDGRVLIAGGAGPGGTGTLGDMVDVEVYDPATGRSTVVGSIGPGRGLTAGPALRLADGSVLIPGGPVPGAGCPNVDTAQAMYHFDPRAQRVTSLASIPHVVKQAVALRDGRVLLFGVHGAVPGGCASGNQEILSPWIGVYDPSSGTTAETTDPTTGAGSLQLQVTRWYASGAVLPDGRVALIADGPNDAVSNAVDLLALTH
jgi:hypothetical protein